MLTPGRSGGWALPSPPTRAGKSPPAVGTGGVTSHPGLGGCSPGSAAPGLQVEAPSETSGCACHAELCPTAA